MVVVGKGLVVPMNQSNNDRLVSQSHEKWPGNDSENTNLRWPFGFR